MALILGLRMARVPTVLFFLLAMLLAPYCMAQLSSGSTIPNYSESDLHSPNSENIPKFFQLPNKDFGKTTGNEIDSPKNKFFLKDNESTNSTFIDRQIDKHFGSDFTFSVRTPSSGVFDPKNTRDDITDYKDCLTKTINIADQAKCNIEILFGKKFNL
jgi:hypothetical protein